MKTLLEVLRLSADYLRGRGIEHPRREAEWLFCDALGMQRLQLYLEYDRPLNAEELARCRQGLLRRGAGEPLQYIRGQVEFYGCQLTVDKRALIPRQETELLVDSVVRQLEKENLAGKVLWDLCCGSGCIAIALKKRLPQLQVMGSDVSAAALTLAAHNATRNDVVIEWLQGDFLAPFTGHPPVDYCICNPPYVSAEELTGLAREVYAHEPLLALAGGDDGLLFYRRLAEGLATHLQPGGRIWLEIGATQGPAVAALFAVAPWQACQLQQDLAGHDRFITCVRN